MRYAVIDVETTGLFPSRDRIVEIALVVVEPDGAISDEFASVVNPGRDVGPTSIHGLTAADVLPAPSFPDLAGEILDRVRPTTGLAAHNVRFDLQFLTAECARIGISLPPVPTACTMMLSGGGRLPDCCAALGIDEPAEAHAALEDALAAARLLGTFLKLGKCRCHPQPVPWPSYPRSGHVPVRRGEIRQREYSNPYMGRLLRLAGGGVNRSASAGEALAYLSLLERVLEDRVIDEAEGELLVNTAIDWGLSRTAVDELHGEFLRHLAVAALIDGVITSAERRDLESVARLLGKPSQDIDDALDEAQQRLQAASSQLQRGTSDLRGRSICFTGELKCRINGNLITREEAELLATGAGLKVASSVTKKLDVLVVADPQTQSSKAKKARQYGTRILAEEVFWTLIGCSVD